ncbi:MAG TPA: (2Fe-2S)-binding protein [Planctomycetota bacterium]|nr:(2Fe-2S)-binding protein [Planctomycetota bacterium]
MTRFFLNGRPVEVETSARPLLDALRLELRLTGTKEGCGEGECGACSVLIGDRVVNSCLVPVCQVEGESVTTVEGLGSGGDLTPLQRAFVERGAAQCGICTPGILLAAASLLREKAAPSLEEVRRALAGNLCRCTGYSKILDAVLAAGGGT